ncbi:MAG: peptidase [Eubacterium sp.]|nr:peptidase [Eubacterium sp.]
MLSSIWQGIKNAVHSKLFPVILTYVLLFGIIIVRMFHLQIIQGESYDKKASIRNTRERAIKSARGEIYDCNGKLLAGNEQSYAVTLEDTGELDNNIDKNKMILKLFKLIKKNGDKIEIEFPIKINKKGKKVFRVDKNEELRFKRDIFFKKSVDELEEAQQNMSAEQVFNYLRTTDKPNTTRFFSPEKTDPETNEKLEPNYTDEEALQIMTLRYAMLMKTYSKYEPITVSSNVNEKTVAAVKESSADLPGVEIATELHRVYYASEYFSHIIGYTGLVSSEQLEQFRDTEKENEYSASDQIGKTGIEKAYEDTLKGSKGSETLVLDSSSRIVNQAKTKDPVSGNDVYLSIDSKLQKATYTLAAKNIAGILLSKLVDSKSHGTKGKKASGILVSIYDVYKAIIQNSIIDVTRFSEDDASKLEKRIYSRFTGIKKRVIRKIKKTITYYNTTKNKSLSKSTRAYLEYIYDMLVKLGILDSKSMDTSDSTFEKYKKGDISLSEFLVYAAKNNWVNLENLDIDANYYSSEEVFEKIRNYIIDELQDDVDFDKCIYKVMIDQGLLTGDEICLLMFDQKVIKYNKSEYTDLETGSMSPYSFIRKKISEMELSVGELGLTPCACSVVVTDVKTGKVMSMVSYPSYDNNKFANSVDSDYYSKISTSSASPLMNRATQQKTAPGSTFKMITATTVLEEGVVGLNDRVKDKVTFDKINRPWPKCWSSVGHGNINVTQAIQHSCNYFFYEMGYRLGNGKENVVDNERGLALLKKYADMYGLTSKSGVELSEAEPTFSDIDTVRSAIGQGSHSYTPAQLSRYVTTLASGGTCYDLTLVDKIRNSQNDKDKKNKANIKDKLELTPSTLNAVKTGMHKVVSDGSITPLFKKLPVEVAGKTGTAQVNDNVPNHALFVSFAPYNNPEISVTVQIPNGFTSSNAAELASKIYRYYFDEKSRDKLLNEKVKVPSLGSNVVTD